MKQKTYKDIIKEIEPFIKPKKYIQYSTAGKWTIFEFLIEEDEQYLK